MFVSRGLRWVAIFLIAASSLRPFQGSLRADGPTGVAPASLPAITSFNSYSDDWRSSFSNGRQPRTADLSEMTISEAIEAGVKWKRGRSNWTALSEVPDAVADAVSLEFAAKTVGAGRPAQYLRQFSEILPDVVSLAPPVKPTPACGGIPAGGRDQGRFNTKVR